MASLKFLKTMEVEEFKKMQHVDQIEIKKNGNTGKCFFVFGLETGPVSNTIKTGQLTSPVISQVCSEDTGQIFYLLHQKGEGTVQLLATL